MAVSGMGGVAGELPLGGEGIVQSFQHLVEGVAELPEFRQGVLVHLHVCKRAQLHLFHLRGKAAQRLQGVSTDEIGQDAAQYRHCRSDVPVGHTKILLCPMDNDGDILPGLCRLRVKESGIATGWVVLQGFSDGIHVVDTGGAEQQLHGNAGDTDEQDGH